MSISMESGLVSISKTVNRVRDTLKQRPRASTFRSGAFLPTDYDDFLLKMPEYDRQKNNGELVRLIDDRLKIKFVYQSLYGDRNGSLMAAADRALVSCN